MRRLIMIPGKYKVHYTTHDTTAWVCPSILLWQQRRLAMYFGLIYTEEMSLTHYLTLTLN